MKFFDGENNPPQSSQQESKINCDKSLQKSILSTAQRIPDYRNVLSAVSGIKHSQ